MGIRGLTKFISQNALLEKYKLHDTNLVIDGNTIYRQLYQIYSTERNSCFGGDYDKFADYIDEFFEVLDSCKVVPYRVFQGGIEHRRIMSKMKKISSRFQSMISIDSTTDESDFTVFLPLCIGDVFESIVLKRNIKTVRCDFESITATLSISKTLNCPILSYDSDFFMCSEISYIPFQNMCESFRKPYLRVIREIGTGFKYIPCQIFKVDWFLEKLGLTPDKLPLLAAMLGNNFIDTKDYPKFYLWPERSNFQRRIGNIASWLRSRNVETAEEDILNLTKGAERDLLKLKLKQATKSYKCFQSRYIVKLGLLENFELPENKVEMENNRLVEGISEVFLQNFRECRYTAYLMDILVHNWYRNFKPLLDKMDLPHSHTLSEDILSAIQRILTNSQAELECVVRVGDRMTTKKLPLCRVQVPTFLEIQAMDVEDRKLVVLRILGLDFLSKDSFRVFPESWQLFMIVLLYMQRRSSLTRPLCYSLILCKTILEQVDKENGRLIRCCEKTFNNTTQGRRSMGDPRASKILHEMDNFMAYFKMREDMRVNSDLFDKKLVHKMSQFQSCLYHIKLLNDLLNMPFTDLLISDCFNGTFIYNFSKILEEQTNIDDFIEMSLLPNSPTIITTLQSLVTELKKIEKQ